MARPVAAYLVRFDTQDASPSLALEPASPPPPVEPLPEDSPEDSGDALREAREEGYAAGMAAARAESDVALAQERLSIETRLAVEREAWTREESAKLAEQIVIGLSEIEANIAASAAGVLRGFLVESLHRRSIDMLAETIRSLVGAEADKLVEISGRADLLEALGHRLAGLAAGFDWRVAPTPDIKIVSGPTIIETRLAAWREQIDSLSE